MIAQAGGQTWDLLVFRLFSLSSSASDHSATTALINPNALLSYVCKTRITRLY